MCRNVYSRINVISSEANPYPSITASLLCGRRYISIFRYLYTYCGKPIYISVNTYIPICSKVYTFYVHPVVPAFAAFADKAH